MRIFTKIQMEWDGEKYVTDLANSEWSEYKGPLAECKGASPWGAIGGILGGVAGSFLGPIGTSLGSSLGSAIGGGFGGGSFGNTSNSSGTSGYFEDLNGGNDSFSNNYGMGG